MNNKFIAGVATAATLAAGLLGAIPAHAANNISGSGSSFAFNAIAYAASNYDSADNVSYTSKGSSTGRSEFKNGTTDFAVSDGTYSSSDHPSFAYKMVPLVGGPVVFAYNATKKFQIGNKKYTMPAGLKLTPAVISGILKGTIAKWNNSAIKKLNPKAILPNHAINVYYRVSGSGTTANLTNYLNQTSGSAWTANSKDLAAAAGGTLAAGSIAKNTSAVLANAVAGDTYGFGYFDLSDAASTRVNKALLKNAYGQYVAPTAAAGATFLNAQNAVVDGSNNITDGTLTIDFTKKVKNAYQLSIVTYGIAKTGSGSSAQTSVKNFFTYVVTKAMPKYAASHGYIALTGKLKATALSQISNIG